MTGSAKDPFALHGAGKFIETRFGPIYYETEGSGPPVYLISGGPGSGHAHYHPWFSALADTHTVVYFDNLGTGASVRLKDRAEYTLAAYAEVIDALRQALGHDKITVLGLSFGAFPAIEYALNYGQHLSSLILSNGHLSAATWQASNIDNVNHDLRLLYPDTWDQFMALREQGVKSGDPRVQELVGSKLADLYWVDPWGHPKLFNPGGPENENNMEVYLGFIGDDPEWEVTGTLAGYDPSVALKEFRQPVLIVTGRYDRVTPPLIAHQLKEAFPAKTVEMTVFERSAHRPWVEESEAYFDRVRAFLAKAGY